jgi:hypothetical protein
MRHHESSADVCRDSRRLRGTDPPVPSAFQRRAARTARSLGLSRSEPGSPAARSPPSRAENPATPSRPPPPNPAASLGPRSHSPRSCPARPADLRDSRREGLFGRGTDQQRLEKCQSQGQQAASSHLRDRSSSPPRSPTREEAGLEAAGGEKERSLPGPRASGGRGARGRGRGEGEPRAGQGRWRADPLH